jgi:hypothetical protein
VESGKHLTEVNREVDDGERDDKWVDDSKGKDQVHNEYMIGEQVWSHIISPHVKHCEPPTMVLGYSRLNNDRPHTGESFKRSGSVVQ